MAGNNLSQTQPPYPTYAPPNQTYSYSQQGWQNQQQWNQQQWNQQQQPQFAYRPPVYNAIQMPSPAEKRRRQCTRIYFAFRQATIALSIVLIFLNVSIYVNGRARRYIGQDTPPTAEVYLNLWLSVPLAGAVSLWYFVSLVTNRGRRSGRGPPTRLAACVDLIFALGATACFIFTIFVISRKNQRGYYGYPYAYYDGIMAFCLGALA
jgi:hypothetical protein